jgi:dihydrodipicolinate synthase/N-acetylneuraminate lyase
MRMGTIPPGVYAITATPFDEDGRLDEGSLASLVDFEIRAGVHGLAIRKEILRRRGAIQCAGVRSPGSVLDDVTAQELDGVLERMGIEAGPAPIRLT